MAFLRRFPSKKEVHQAIAEQSSWHLKMAGKVDAVDATFSAQEIVTHIDGRQTQYLDEINIHKKLNFRAILQLPSLPSIGNKLVG
ncbi:group 1 glycosyl transferase [Nostoc sp. NIES-2111]|nr:group 1 glycosyl transferase [Nostoc sp. NIES-2111]